jgi:hypothetical protein
MAAWLRTVASVTSLLAALAMGYLGGRQFLDGVAVEAAIPVPVYMIAQIKMPLVAYRDATAALAGADVRDGAYRIARAEAALRSGVPPGGEISELTEGLTDQPASTRGWTLLSAALIPVDRQKAARSLSTALLLAPNDYWLVGPRAQIGALLWSDLDSDSRTLVLQQTRDLWTEPDLRGQLRALLASPAGVALVGRAYADDPDEIRRMNRWLSAARVSPADEP